MKDNTVETGYHTPVAPEKAARYLAGRGYTDPRRLLGSARSLSGYMCSFLPEQSIERFLQSVYDGEYHSAYGFIEKMFELMDERVPKSVQALYSCYPMWKVYMDLVYDAVSEFAMQLIRPYRLGDIRFPADGEQDDLSQTDGHIGSDKA